VHDWNGVGEKNEEWQQWLGAGNPIWGEGLIHEGQDLPIICLILLHGDGFSTGTPHPITNLPSQSHL